MTADAGRTLRSVLWSAGAFAAFYLLQGGLKLGGLVYDPVARHFFFSDHLAFAQMRYYGDVLGACAGSGLAWLLSSFVPLRRPPDVGVLTGAVLALFALDVTFFFSRVVAVL